MAWTNLDVEHVEVAIRFMPRGVRRLNLSGIREKNCLNDEGKRILECIVHSRNASSLCSLIYHVST